MSGWLIVGLVAGSAAYYQYKKNRDPEDIYPAWKGKMVDKRGRSYQIFWQDFKIIDGTTIWSNGVDTHGCYKIRGKVDQNGEVLFTLTRPSVPPVRFVGRVSGPNQVSGTWNKFSIDHGTFQISCDTDLYQATRSRQSTGNPDVVDMYPMAFSSKRNNIVGLGIDEAGFFRIQGRARHRTSLKMLISYPSKFSILVTGCKAGRDGEFVNGTWKVAKVGSGKCHLLRSHRINETPRNGRAVAGHSHSRPAPRALQPDQLGPAPAPYRPQQQSEEYTRLVEESRALNYPSVADTNRNTATPQPNMPHGHPAWSTSNQPHYPGHGGQQTPFG